MKRARPPVVREGSGERRFAEVVEAFAADPRLAPIAEAFLAPSTSEKRKGFGSNALKVDGKIFAMLVKDRLVVKLSRERVEALVAAEKGEPFDPGHGRRMKEWVTIHDDHTASWIALAKEAHDFVRSRSSR